MKAIKQKGVFGKDLQEACSTQGGNAPAILTESLQSLQQGLKNPNLFKGIADKRKVQLLQKAWDQGRNPMRLAKILDVSAVSDCLLNWLNSLPSPLIPCKFFHAFLHIHQSCSHPQWLFQVHALFEKLEPHESCVIIPLLSFLHEYEQFHRGKEFRNPSLGSRFGPAFLKAHTNALPLPFPEDIRAVAALVDCLISDFDLIFKTQQTPCSPVKKPPSRAKTSPTKRELLPWAQATNSLEEKRNQFGAKAVWMNDVPVKHLKVNIPSLQDENCNPTSSSQKCLGGLASAMREADVSSSIGSLIAVETPTLIQEEDPDPELENVVGDLLCGSLSGVLFEPDDQRFLDRTASLMSTLSPSISCYQSEVSTELSSDEEMAHFLC